MSARQDMVLWGATGHARVLNELVGDSLWRICALVDNRPMASPIEGIPVLVGVEGLDAWMNTRVPHRPLFGAVAVGGSRGADRLQLLDTFASRGIQIVTLVHRTAFIATDSEIGNGSQVLANACVCSHAKIGRGVIINTSASIDHDCIVEDGVHVAPGVRVAGAVVVGARAFLGIGAVVLPRLTIGADAVVGAGAVVTHNVSPGCIVVGNPARLIIKT